MQYDEKCIIVVRSLRYNIKISRRSSSLAMLHSSLHPRDVTAKNVNVITSRNMTKIYSRERWHKSRSNGCLKAKPQANDFAFGGHLTLFFRGMIFERAMEKGRRKRAGGKVKFAA